MIDLHAHVLPGVDDGPVTWDETLALVRAAAGAGVTAMAATPHMLPDGPWANERDRILPLVDELRRRVEREGLGVDIVPGGEVYVVPDAAERVRKGKAMTYGDAGRYMLLELPPSHVPPYLERVLFELRVTGVTPIIAHPERYDVVQRDPDIVWEWHERGALLQLNVGSLPLAGPLGRTARALLAMGAVHLLASDAHGVDKRPPLRAKDFERAAAFVGEPAARRLLCDNPTAVLAGEPVPAVQPVTPPPREPSREGWLGRLWRRSWSVGNDSRHSVRGGTG